MVVQRGDDLLLGAAGVGNERSLGAVLGRLLHVLGDLAHGRADDHHFGLSHSFGEIDRGMGDGADAPGDPQADLPAADADDVFGQISLAEGQADRSSDQPHADDGHISKSLHQSIPADAQISETVL